MYLVRYLSISSDVLATAFFTTRRYASVACAMVPSVCLSVTSRCCAENPMKISWRSQTQATRCIIANLMQPNKVDARRQIRLDWHWITRLFVEWGVSLKPWMNWMSFSALTAELRSHKTAQDAAKCLFSRPHTYLDIPRIRQLSYMLASDELTLWRDACVTSWLAA